MGCGSPSVAARSTSIEGLTTLDRVGGEIRIRDEALEWREVEGEIVALDLRTSTYLAINRTGAAIWADLAAGASREALTTRLVESFGIDADAARRDLDSVLDDLAQRDLLQD